MRSTLQLLFLISLFTLTIQSLLVPLLTIVGFKNTMGAELLADFLDELDDEVGDEIHARGRLNAADVAPLDVV